jgi:hypothetical protein
LRGSGRIIASRQRFYLVHSCRKLQASRGLLNGDRAMNSKTVQSATTVLSIYDGRHCIGFVLPRGKVGFEARGRDEQARVCSPHSKTPWPRSPPLGTRMTGRTPLPNRRAAETSQYPSDETGGDETGGPHPATVRPLSLPRQEISRVRRFLSRRSTLADFGPRYRTTQAVVERRLSADSDQRQSAADARVAEAAAQYRRHQQMA